MHVLHGLFPRLFVLPVPVLEVVLHGEHGARREAQLEVRRVGQRAPAPDLLARNHCSRRACHGRLVPAQRPLRQGPDVLKVQHIVCGFSSNASLKGGRGGTVEPQHEIVPVDVPGEPALDQGPCIPHHSALLILDTRVGVSLREQVLELGAHAVVAFPADGSLREGGHVRLRARQVVRHAPVHFVLGQREWTVVGQVEGALQAQARVADVCQEARDKVVVIEEMLLFALVCALDWAVPPLPGRGSTTPARPIQVPVRARVGPIQVCVCAPVGPIHVGVSAPSGDCRPFVPGLPAGLRLRSLPLHDRLLRPPLRVHVQIRVVLRCNHGTRRL